MKNYTEIIEKYIDVELESDELEWFENEIKSNPEFKNEVSLHKEIDVALRERDVIVLRKQLDKIQRSAIDEKPEKSIFHKRVYYLAAAASLAILIALGSLYYILFLSKPYSNDQLYSMFYNRDKAVMIVRSANQTTSSDEVLLKALQSYEQKDYNQAISLFNQISDKLIARYFAGISYMETANYDDAIASFKSIIDQKDNLFIEQAEWYLGLCYLKTNATDKAIVQFKSIASSNSFYKTKATNILKNVK